MPLFYIILITALACIGILCLYLCIECVCCGSSLKSYRGEPCDLEQGIGYSRRKENVSNNGSNSNYQVSSHVWHDTTYDRDLINQEVKGPKVPKAAVRKHMFPECNTDKDALRFSLERNQHDMPTFTNTVFKIRPDPSQFILVSLDGEKVSLVPIKLSLLYLL